MFISDADEYVKPRRVLDKFYINTDELVSRYALQERISDAIQLDSAGETPDSVRQNGGQSLRVRRGELLDIFRLYPWLISLPAIAVAGLIGILLLIQG